MKIKSEWLFRLIENLESDIGCIATNEPNFKRISCQQKSLNPYSAKLIRKFDENLNVRYIYPLILKNLEIKHSTTVNYVHFIGFAIKIKNFILDSKNPTIIHCHGKDIMWDLKDFKTGQTIHSPTYFNDLKKIANRAYFLANSTYTRNQLLEQGIKPNRIFINYFGINLEPLINKSDKDKFRILYLGRLVDFKGPLEVISAFEKASNMGMEGELIIAGGGEMENECKDIIKKSIYRDNIKLIGWVDKAQANDLYRNADVFTAHNKKDKNTNQVEAFGVTIIEAMSYGLPVITGSSGGVTDSVVDSETGFLIEPGDVNNHAQKFFDLYQDKNLRKEMGEKARLRIKEKFSPDKERENFHAILQSIQATQNEIIK